MTYPAFAHQRVLREKHALDDSQPLPTVPLAECRVELVDRETAAAVILKYEWLGDLGQSGLFVGLFAPRGELLGASCFGHGPPTGQPRRPTDAGEEYGTMRDLIGSPAYCLERGACTHRAPPNAASWLITRACKLVRRSTGVERFFAYADPRAGEYGGVYQAANWLYLGQGLQGWRGSRKERYYALPPGGDPGDLKQWKSTRALRRPGLRLKFAEARALGWRIEYLAAKHVYAVHVGAQRDRRAWRDAFGVLPSYPAPRPELKIRRR